MDLTSFLPKSKFGRDRFLLLKNMSPLLVLLGMPSVFVLFPRNGPSKLFS